MSLKFLDPEGHLPEAGRAQLESAFAALMGADYKEAYEGLAVAVADEDTLTRAFGLLYLGDLYHFQWDFALSATSYKQARELFESIGHTRGTIMTQLRVADIIVDEADSTEVPADRLTAARAEGAALLDRAAADAEGLGDDFLRGFVRHYQALFATEQREYARAGELAADAIAIRERIGDDVFGPSSAALLARAKAELGDFAQAVALAEKTFQTQMERGLRGAALRTLTILSYINERRQIQLADELVNQFTAVEPIARTPYLLGGVSEKELAVAAHAAGDETPLMAAHGQARSARQSLVSDARVAVMMLVS
jgi:hypothetical protein